MATQTTSTQPKHPIQVTAAYTGLSIDRIRAWEKRYDAVTPTRDNNQRRLYSDADIERLTLLKKAVDIGRRISEVVKLSPERLAELVKQDTVAVTHQAAVTQRARPSTGTVMEYFDLCLDAITYLDTRTLCTILKDAVADLGHVFLLEDMLLPLINHVHEECRRSELQNVHVSMLKETLRMNLISLCTPTHDNHAGNNKVVICSPESDMKMFALRAAAMATLLGWQTINLGCRVDVHEIYDAVQASDADAVIIGLSDIGNDTRSPNQLRFLTSLLSEQIALFAYVPFNYSYLYAFNESGITPVNTLSELSAQLNKLAK